VSKAFISWPTTFQRIEYSRRGGKTYAFPCLGDNGVILAKTKTPSDLELEIVVYYKIKEELLEQLYVKYPSKNYHKDYANVVKVTVVSGTIEFYFEDS